MKKYLLQVALFFAIIAVVDFTVGKLFRYVQANRAGGRTGAEWYACRESNEDIIIMGSSRASHHYVPQILADSLGMSCLNAGQDGNGIILQYGRWKMISERYTPKLIIFDVTTDFDLCQNDNMTYIDHLKPFCDDSEVKKYIVGLFPIERWKLFSKMYRYNYKFIEMMSDCVKSDGIEWDGYIPLYGQIRQEIVNGVKKDSIKHIEYDETKLQFLECLAKECKEKNIKLIFVVSPYYNGGSFNKDSFLPVNKIAARYGMPFFYLNINEFTENPMIFKDSYHLNDNGAKEFTAELVRRIKP